MTPSVYEETLASFSIAKPTTLRVNTLKTTKEALEQSFQASHITLTPVPWFPGAYIVNDTPLRTLTELDTYKEGHFYVQSLSSMIPALILDPKPEERVLDLCAAPGSKTTQMAAMMGNTGTILASDNSRLRIYKLDANLKMQGVTNTTVLFASGQAIWEQYPESFDKTLVDVPCSMEGRISTLDPITYEQWSTGKIKELAGRQRWLLRSAISATKPGGTIVYSTCTMAPEENENIIDWILKKEQGKVVLEDIHIEHLSYTPGLSVYKEKHYDDTMTKTMRIYPSASMEGFFVAKLKKRSSTLPGATKKDHSAPVA
jgi:16S rRNA (cytosine1407-C5)-methyltransferase